MKVTYLITDKNDDLYLSYYGHQNCAPEHLYGPAVRDHYLWVYIIRGKGIYKAFGMEYPLSKGQSFVVFPNELTRYQADAAEPWEYMWIGFSGSKAGEMLKRIGVHIAQPTCDHQHSNSIEAQLERLLEYESTYNDELDKLFYTGSLNGILFEMGRDWPEQSKQSLSTLGNINDSYIVQAHNFMKQHYDKNIDVSTVANFVGLERSYFTKKFTAATGESPYECIMKLRLARAVQLLEQSSMSIEHIALLLGFSSPFHFSNFFKKRKDCSPMAYRKR